MDRIVEILIQEMEKYAVPGLNSVSYMTQNPTLGLYTVVTTVVEQYKRYSFMDLYVRLVGDKIVIEHDANSDPLYEALIQAGIPPKQIILAYAGQLVPDTA